MKLEGIDPEEFLDARPRLEGEPQCVHCVGTGQQLHPKTGRCPFCLGSGADLAARGGQESMF